MRFIFPHSHAFRRGRVIIDDGAKTGSECLIEFGDGITVVGEWHSSGDAIMLSVPAYRTAKGTAIAAKEWALAKGGDGIWRSVLIA